MESLNPSLSILNCALFDGLGQHEPLLERTTQCYEVEYFISCEGGIKCDGKLVNFENGSINFRKPGQLVQGIPPYKCIGLYLTISDSNDISHIFDKIPFKLNAQYCVDMEKIMYRVFENFNINTIECQLLMKSDLYLLLSMLLNVACDDNNKIYNCKALKAKQYIEQHFKDDINVEVIARYVGMEKHYFQNVFKETIGVTPWRYVNRLRIGEAKNLLSITDLNMSDIAEKSGFMDAVYFSYVFKQNTGLSPRKYRDQFRSKS